MQLSPLRYYLSAAGVLGDPPICSLAAYRSLLIDRWLSMCQRRSSHPRLRKSTGQEWCGASRCYMPAHHSKDQMGP
jgi:hypothetical protein